MGLGRDLATRVLNSDYPRLRLKFYRVLTLIRALIIGLLAAIAGGFVGVLLFFLLIRMGSFDGPGGGMAVFPFVLVPAIGLGLYGFSVSLNKSRRRQTDSQ